MKERKLITTLFVVSILLVSPILGTGGAVEDSIDEVKQTVTVQYTFFDQNGSIIERLFNISWEDLKNLNNSFSDIINKTLSGNFTNITEAIKDFYDNHTWLKRWFRLQSLRPLEKRVFIVSSGYGKKIDIRPFASMDIYRPLTFWLYFGKSNYTNRSKTIIVDPILPKIRILKGFQFGMMRRFVGVYIRVSGTPLQKDHIFFMGYAYKVRTFAKNTISFPILSKISGKVI